MRGIGLDPMPMENGDRSACATCFSKCTLGLKPGDQETCTTVMSINDEILSRLGGKMIIQERLTDIGGTRCVVKVQPCDEIGSNPLAGGISTGEGK